ncbi:hypothetical protein PLESTF_001706800 [Pleodorina starrii]|nr:hypothetical protein PLESTF_001706800 [Pleodorina starrii]
MELAREAFATDSAEVDQKEAKKKARTVALEAARVVQPANQQEAAAAATRPTGAQQDTRRSSRVVRKTSLGVDDYFNKTDLQPDDDKYLGEEERRAAQSSTPSDVLRTTRLLRRVSCWAPVGRVAAAAASCWFAGCTTRAASRATFLAFF